MATIDTAAFVTGNDVIDLRKVFDALPLDYSMGLQLTEPNGDVSVLLVGSIGSIVISLQVTPCPEHDGHADHHALSALNAPSVGDARDMVAQAIAQCQEHAAMVGQLTGRELDLVVI